LWAWSWFDMACVQNYLSCKWLWAPNATQPSFYMSTPVWCGFSLVSKERTGW
jgi:hypothetical protein